jgi:hypothetical protein
VYLRYIYYLLLVIFLIIIITVFLITCFFVYLIRKSSNIINKVNNIMFKLNKVPKFYNNVTELFCIRNIKFLYFMLPVLYLFYKIINCLSKTKQSDERGHSE